jgi:hypothetical protein
MEIIFGKSNSVTDGEKLLPLPCHSRLRGTSRERSQSIKKPGDKESDAQNRELLIILFVETRHGRTWVGDETVDVRGSSVATCGGFGRRHDDSESRRDSGEGGRRIRAYGVGNPGPHDDVASSCCTAQVLN